MGNSEEPELLALSEAVRKARAKAEAIARAGGVFLRQVVGIQENGVTPVGGVS